MKYQEQAMLLDLKVDPKVAEGKIKLKIVDREGKLVEGALVGRFAYWEDFDPKDYDPKYKIREGLQVHLMGGQAKATGKRGTALLRNEDLFQRGMPKDFASEIVVIHEGRKLGAIGAACISTAGRSGTVTLQPLCRVRGKLTSTSLKKLGRDFYGTNTEVRTGGLLPITHRSTRRRYDMLLPPGKYRLGASGNGTFNAWLKLDIKPGQRSITNDLDMPADRLARLFGKRPPEFKNIQAWNKFGPVTLKELRGKVVLLDFWGFWCGPCVHSIPNLMALHDKYHEKGLEIIAIHDSSVKSMRELSAKCREAKKELWGGRSLPFRVAIDGGGETHIPGFPKRYVMEGHMVANYGIMYFPTSLLIGRDGVLLKQTSIQSPMEYLTKDIEPLLGD